MGEWNPAGLLSAEAAKEIILGQDDFVPWYPNNARLVWASKTINVLVKQGYEWNMRSLVMDELSGPTEGSHCHSTAAPFNHSRIKLLKLKNVHVSIDTVPTIAGQGEPQERKL